MLKFLSFLIKMTLFSILVLILGNKIHWKGKTISDQVKIGMAHAEKSPLYESVQAWSKKLTLDAKIGASKKEKYQLPEDLLPSERQKLKALIRELNH